MLLTYSFIFYAEVGVPVVHCTMLQVYICSLAEYDAVLCSILSNVTNTPLEHHSPYWSQASLPVRSGGLGVCNTVELAPICLPCIHTCLPTPYQCNLTFTSIHSSSLPSQMRHCWCGPVDTTTNLPQAQLLSNRLLGTSQE